MESELARVIAAMIRKCSRVGQINYRQNQGWSLLCKTGTAEHWVEVTGTCGTPVSQPLPLAPDKMDSSSTATYKQFQGNAYTSTSGIPPAFAIGTVVERMDWSGPAGTDPLPPWQQNAWGRLLDTPLMFFHPPFLLANWLWGVLGTPNRSTSAELDELGQFFTAMAELAIAIAPQGKAVKAGKAVYGLSRLHNPRPPSKPDTRVPRVINGKRRVPATRHVVRVRKHKTGKPTVTRQTVRGWHTQSAPPRSRPGYRYRRDQKGTVSRLALMAANLTGGTVEMIDNLYVATGGKDKKYYGPAIGWRPVSRTEKITYVANNLDSLDWKVLEVALENDLEDRFYAKVPSLGTGVNSFSRKNKTQIDEAVSELTDTFMPDGSAPTALSECIASVNALIDYLVAQIDEAYFGLWERLNLLHLTITKFADMIPGTSRGEAWQRTTRNIKSLAFELAPYERVPPYVNEFGIWTDKGARRNSW